ncbi:MAG: Hsp20/alpha crystallin family protein [Candidatus Bilamarchaeaceae archaeon]
MAKEIRVYDPFEEMRRRMREMDEMMESLFIRPRKEEWVIRSPLSDLVDKGDKFELSVELPGMEKEDIHIEADKSSISISAERRKAEEEKKKNYYYCERSYTGYKRTFSLPEEIDPEAVDAEFKNGVLKVEMKKAAPRERKKEVKIK